MPEPAQADGAELKADAWAANGPSATARSLPWRRPGVMAIAVALFLIVGAARFSSDDPSMAISMLYLLPIALLASELGVRGGVASSLLAAVLVVAWVLLLDVDVPIGEVVLRCVILTSLGTCFGLLGDRLSQAVTERALLGARTGELAAVNKELEAFSYSIAHDLRAPLRAIDGYSLAILDDYAQGLPKGARDDLTRVRNASQRMSTLIDELLGLSRITRRELVRAPVDLSVLAEEIAAEMRLRESRRAVEIDIQPGLHVNGDPTLLRLVLQNLLENAWKFTAKTENAHVKLACVGSENGHSTFAVHDNGAGFDMRYAEKLFRPFERLHRQEEYGGTGVGLTTVARVLNRHGGRIWAEGTPGKGATFFFDLPTR